MIITTGNVWASTPPGPLRARALHHLRYRQKGYQFVEAFRRGSWDGYRSLVTKTGHFPAGLVPYLVDKLAGEGLAVEIEDARVVPQPCPVLAQVVLQATLEPHQTEAVLAAEAGVRGVIHHPTASGKTFVAAGIIHRLKVPALVLVHTKDLLWQMHERLSTALDSPGLIGVLGDGRDEPNWITCATFQTIHKRITELGPAFQQVLDRFGLVIVDEVHHAAADSYASVLKALGSCYYRIGLSATPFREGDDETYFKVTGWLGPTLSRMTQVEALSAGRSVPADVYLLDPGPPDPDCSDYQTAYRTGIVRHENRNRIIVDVATRMAGKGAVLILVERIEHGQGLISAFPTSTKIEFISGADHSNLRAAALERLRSGKTSILISSVILDEGVDLPNVRTLILAGAGKAPHKIIQRLGRGMRSAEGKDRVVVIDFADKGMRGYRDKQTGALKQRPGQLAGQAKERRKTYESEPAYSVTEIGYEELMGWLT